MQLFDLTGRVAIVTGGNGGIGLGMARGMATAGAAIVVAARDEAKSVEAVRELEGLGAQAVAVRVDVTQEASCRAMVQSTLDRFGRLDILVNNAGTTIRKQPQEYTLEEWHLILETNLTSAFACSQAAYPAMRQAGGGKIIMIGSMMSIFGASFTGPYAATKGGIVQLAKALGCAWAKDNIQVNSVLPGWIDSALTRRRPPGHCGARGASGRAHPSRPLGHAGRFRRHRGVPGQPGLGLHHRRGDYGRRRLLGPGLTAQSPLTRWRPCRRPG